jgi:hypothetical protein
MSDHAGIHAVHVAEEREQRLADALHATTLQLVETRQELRSLQERHLLFVLEQRGYVDCDRVAG